MTNILSIAFLNALLAEMQDQPGIQVTLPKTALRTVVYQLLTLMQVTPENVNSKVNMIQNLAIECLTESLIDTLRGMKEKNWGAMELPEVLDLAIEQFQFMSNVLKKNGGNG